MLRWALLLALLSTSALASRADRLSVSPRLDRRDRLGATVAAPDPILLSLSLLPPDSECSGTPPDGVTFTRASAATCIDSSGVAHALTTDEARVHGALGLLVEGSATNAVLHSRDVVAAAWVGTGCSKTATGMDGATLVGRCTGATSVSQTLTVATGARTASAYVRRQSGTCTVTLSADSESAGKALTGGWERLTLTYTSDGSVAVGIGVSSGCVADIDYVQDEAGGVATSPIVTAGTAAVRAAEFPTTPNALAGRGDAPWCLAIEAQSSLFEHIVVESSTYLIANAVGIYASGASAKGTFNVTDALAAFRQVKMSVPEAEKDVFRVYVGAGTPTGAATLAVDGVPATVSSGTGTGIVSAHLPGLQIGHRAGRSDLHLGGHIRNLVLGRTPEACQ